MARIPLSRNRSVRAGPCSPAFRAMGLLMVVTVGLAVVFVVPRHVGEVGRSSARIASAQIARMDHVVNQSPRAEETRAGRSKAES